jgi:flagellar motor switch protein FliG
MMNSADEENVVNSLRERDADLAQKIVDEMFVFENLLDVEDRGIQLILKEVENDTLMVALKGAVEELRDKFLRNMSSRAAEILREDLEAQGPIRMSKVEAEQKKILLVARRLAESGQIVLGGQGDDAYV